MKLSEMISTSPLGVEKTVRDEELRVLTSCRAGKIVPVAYIPILREDSVRRGKIRLAFDMAETVHPLMNAVNVTAYAHFVPFLAFERFTGMESFNRSYENKPEPHNGVPVPFIHRMAFDKDAPFWKTMGVHHVPGQQINSAPLEAYNTIVNFRRRSRSDRLPMRTLYDTTLAEAFWKETENYHIVPDFDSAMMEGFAPVTWESPSVRVSGIGGSTAPMATTGPNSVRETGGVTTTHAQRWITGGTTNAPISIEQDADNPGFPAIFAELEQSGAKISLANIELAKRTAAFAKLRQQYDGLDDDHIIDLLMKGIRVPDEALKQPILLDRKSTIFGYSERHAMDGASLDMSVTTGETSLELSFRTPPMNVGGIIMITVEIVPEQLKERKLDHFLFYDKPEQFPDYIRDTLDPEKVQVVRNRELDVFHSNQNGVFGYAPLNFFWKRSYARVGGRYYRPFPETFVEDRQRFWAIEQSDPSLSADFYMVTNMPHSVFLDTITDPFEILALGGVSIVGNTVFGKLLEEDNGDYEAVDAKVPHARIVQG